MKKSFLILPVFFALTAPTYSHAADVTPAIRVVPCDQPVKSLKRGVCVNQMAPADFMVLSPSVSWFYTWHFEPTMPVPAAANMEFLPMVWGARPESLTGLDDYLSSHHPRRVLALNEPNLKGQAFLTPQESADWYKKIKAIADKHEIPVVGPHMALGSAAADSIAAYDPIEKKDVTYTYMVPYVKAFLSYAGDTDTEVSAVAAHSYGNGGELGWLTGMLGDEFGRPAWITEFAWWGAPNVEAERDYMIQAVDRFERTPNIEGYAWFKERANDNPKISLLGKTGELTTLGQTYVNMPVHDAGVYYQLPGRLQAESYFAASKNDIAATSDDNGFLEMRPDGGSTLDYHVAVAKAGTYSLEIRCKTGAGNTFDILSGDKVLMSATSTETGWQTLETTINLPTGNQMLRVKPAASARFNWMEFGTK